MPQPSPDKIARLQRALDDYARGSGETDLFDKEAEESKSKVRERALRLLDQRSRSRHELAQRLEKLEFDPAVVADVLDDLSRVGLVDDATFAREWVRQRHQARGKSARVLDQELQRKGVGAEERQVALEQIDAADERAMAWSLAQKKARGVKAVPADRHERDKALRRIVGVLARRGFRESDSLVLAKKALAEREAELEA
ncbi:regulatory protein RecX [Corynebacterium confusum]